MKRLPAHEKPSKKASRWEGAGRWFEDGSFLVTGKGAGMVVDQGINAADP